MHLPSHKLQLRPKLATVLQHSTDTSTAKTPEPSAPAKTHSSINIKDKRNVKIGIVALRTVSKWTDKAALTLEKLEGQDTSKHCQERQVRLNAGGSDKVDGKAMQSTRVWRETVVYPLPAQVNFSREIEVHQEPNVYRESPPFNKEEGYSVDQIAEMPNNEVHHAHALTTVVEYYNESSDDEDEGKTCKEIGKDNDTDAHTNANEDFSDVSSNQEDEDSEYETEDIDNEIESEEDSSSDDAEDSEEEVEMKHPDDSHVKK